MAQNFSLNRTNLGIFQNIPTMKIFILKIILRKLQNSKKNSKNKTILKIRMLVNTGHGLRSVFVQLHCNAETFTLEHSVPQTYRIKRDDVHDCQDQGQS